jgi:cellulose synthase (UDP-forming)
VREARQALRRGEPIQEVTWAFQRRAEAVSRLLVEEDLREIRAELAEIPGLDVPDLDLGLATVLQDEDTLQSLSGRSNSPLAAVAAVRALLLWVDLDRAEEAEPVLPLATISVTEDMATAMRLHGMGWKSVYHHEVLARGLAPEDLRTALQQRLRWAQGTIQVMLRENPLVQPGLTWGQRLMYFATMWSYLSGFFTIVYLLAPVIYLFFGILPIRALSEEFFWHLLPFLIVNQILFLYVGWGRPTWRGQQYSVALFPLWIKAVTTTLENVYRGKKLGFVVTPKVRQGGISLALIRPQLVMMGLLVAACLFGLGRLAFGYSGEVVAILVNVFWACYSLMMLSVVLDAATYQPPEDEPENPGDSSPPLAPAAASEGRGRIGSATVRL